MNEALVLRWVSVEESEEEWEEEGVEEEEQPGAKLATESGNSTAPKGPMSCLNTPV